MKNKDYSNIIDHIILQLYRYFKQQDIKMLFCTLSKSCSSENIQKHEEELKNIRDLRDIYPKHKLILKEYCLHNSFDALYYRHHLDMMLNISKKGDIIYLDTLQHQIVRENSLGIIMKKLGIQSVANENTTYSTLNILPIEEVVSTLKEHVHIFDKFFAKKFATEICVLATNDKIAKNSSLKVLPKHLLREVCRWF